MVTSDSKRVADEASRWIVRMHSGAASAADRAGLAQWLAADPRHDLAYREAEELWAASNELSQDPASGMVRPGKKRPRKRGPRSLLIVFGLGIAAALAAWSMRGLSHDHATGTAEIRTVVLPDGSRATMNARSAIDVSFTPQGRRITVAQGQVFFEVAPDRSRPFQVEALDTEITALGTAFNVKLLPDLPALEVAVTEHAVEVSAAEGAGRHRVRLSENQQVAVRDGKIGSVTVADPDTVLSWRKGLLIAEGKPLIGVIHELQAYHPGWIVLGTPAAGNLQVSAVLNLNEPGASLDVLAAGLPITVRHLTPYLTVVTAR